MNKQKGQDKCFFFILAEVNQKRKTTKTITGNEFLAIEMEAVALYAFAQTKYKDIICFAHIANQMATKGNDFEKGHHNGNTAIIELI